MSSVEEIEAMLEPMSIEGIMDLLVGTDDCTVTVRNQVESIMNDPNRTRQQKKKAVVAVVVTLFTLSAGEGEAAPETKEKARSVSASSSSASSEEKSDPEEERLRNLKIYRKKERRERRNAASGVEQPKRVVRPMSTSKPRPSCPGPSGVRPKTAPSTSSSSSSSMSVDHSPPRQKSKPKRKRVDSSSDSDSTVVDNSRKPPPQKQSKVITISDSDSDDNDEKTDDELSRRRRAAAEQDDKKTEKRKKSKERDQEKSSYNDKKDKYRKTYEDTRCKGDRASSSTNRDQHKPKASKPDEGTNRHRSDKKTSVRDKEKKHSRKDKSRERDKRREYHKDEDHDKRREKDKNREKHGGQDEYQKKHREKDKEESRDSSKHQANVQKAAVDGDQTQARKSEEFTERGCSKLEEKNALDESNGLEASTEKFLLNQAGVAEVKQNPSHSKFGGATEKTAGNEQQAEQSQPVTSTTDETGKKQLSPLRAQPASESISSSVKITSTQDQMPDDDVLIVDETRKHQYAFEKTTTDSKKVDRQQEDLMEMKTPEKIQKKDFTKDPDFLKYQKKFNLKVFKIELQDIKKQDRYHYTEGDQVYRDWKKAQKEKRKQARVQGHAERHKFEKYGKNTGKTLGEGLKRPTNENLTSKDKRFEALHKKIPKKEKKSDVVLGILSTGISKLLDWRIPKDQAANVTIKRADALRPPQTADRVKFESRKESWTFTEAERAAFADAEREREKLKSKKDDIPAAAGAPAPPSEPEIVFEGGDDVQMDYYDYGEEENVDDQNKEEEEEEAAYSSDESEPWDAHIPCLVPKVGPFTNAVIDFMKEHADAKDFALPGLPYPLPESDDSLHQEQFVARAAKWFRKMERESYYQRAPSLPENKEEEFYMLMLNDDGVEDDISCGNVSNPDGEDLQDTEISSTALDADQEDEYCGAALLNAKLRIDKGETPECFTPLFTLPRGCNYDKKNFQATCNLCSEKLKDKRQLGVHLRGSTHRANILNRSLTLADPEQNISVRFREELQAEMASKMGADNSKTKEKENQAKSSKDTTKTETERKQQSKPAKDSKSKTDVKDKEDKKDDKGKDAEKRGRDRRRSSSRSRKSRSRSPAKRAKSHHRRSRSRSGDRRRNSRSRHHRRSRSRSRSPRNTRRTSDSHSHNRKVDEFLARNEKRSGRRSSPVSKSPKASNTCKRDEDLIFQEKLALQAKGLWTEELEGRWKLMEDDKERLKKFVAVKKKSLEEKPEEHPQYTQEWNRFWERRYQELVDKGKDADSHDYTTEWKQVWSGIAERLLMKEHDDKLIEARVKFGVDLASLKKLNAQAAPASLNRLVQPSNVGYGPNSGYGPPGIQQIPGPGFNPGMNMPGPMNNGQFYPNGGSYQPPLVPLDPFNGMPMAGPMMQTPMGPCFVSTVPMVAPNQPTTSNSAFGMSQQQQSVRPNPPSGGPDPVAPTPTQVPAAAKADVSYSPQAMSISSGGSANTSTSKPVGVTDVLSQWNSITGLNPNAEKSSKPSATASIASSSSSLPPYDYENVTVTQTLKSILELEDYLSFLAGPMKQHYDRAVNQEATQKGFSFQLLKDRDFVQLLFQVRDKFYIAMKARCGTQDVRKKLNEVMFMLNILLDSPQCQKFQPSTNESSAPEQAVITLEPDTPRTPKIVSKTAQQAKQASPEVQVIAQQAISKAVEGLNFQQKKRISQVIASSFMAQGKDRWKEAELMKGIASVVRPITADIQQSRISPEIVMEKLKRKQSARVAPPRRVAPPQDNDYRQPLPPQQFHHRPQPYGARPDYGAPRGYGPPTGAYPGYLPPQPPGPLWARAARPPVRVPYRGPSAADMYVPNPLARRGGGGGGRFMGNPTADEVQNPTEQGNRECGQIEHEPNSPTSSVADALTPEEFQFIAIDPPARSLSEGEVEENTNESEDGSEPAQEGKEQQSAEELSHLPPAIRMLIMKEKEGDLRNSRTEARRRRSKKTESEGHPTTSKRKRRKKVDRTKSEDSLEDRRTDRHKHRRRDRDHHEKPRRRHTEDSRSKRHSDSGSEAAGNRRHHGKSSKKLIKRRVSAVAGVSANFWNEENQEETFIEHELAQRNPRGIPSLHEMDPISDDEVSLTEELLPAEALPEAELISEDETVDTEMSIDAIKDSDRHKGDKSSCSSEAKVCTQPLVVEDGELISDEEL